MNKTSLSQTQSWIKEELDISLNFWLKNGLDKENGGIYTCLDQTGKLYSTDKSVWMQGRSAWTFAFLCKTYGIKQEWLNASKSCLDFMEKYCINHSAGGRMFFQVTADGKPLRQRRYCFSEGFYAIANAEYYGITGEKKYLERAKHAYEIIYKLNNGILEDPTGLGPKDIAETRSGRALANSMIFLNIINVLRKVDIENKSKYDKHSQECAQNIFDYHVKEDMKCTLENVGMDGEFWKDVSVGRIINPGHDMECSWFLMEYANYIGGAQGEKIHNKACEMLDWSLEAGWDKEYGGILYFIDCLGKPPESYEHDMKLWWPHSEALIATIMAYKDTKDEKYLEWFNKTFSYCKEVFSDREYGDWYGYLRRDGKPTMPSTKGSTFKGPFHLPRALIMIDKIIQEILDT